MPATILSWAPARRAAEGGALETDCLGQGSNTGSCTVRAGDALQAIAADSSP